MTSHLPNSPPLIPIFNIELLSACEDTLQFHHPARQRFRLGATLHFLDDDTMQLPAVIPPGRREGYITIRRTSSGDYSVTPRLLGDEGGLAHWLEPFTVVVDDARSIFNCLNRAFRNPEFPGGRYISRGKGLSTPPSAMALKPIAFDESGTVSWISFVAESSGYPACWKKTDVIQYTKGMNAHLWRESLVPGRLFLLRLHLPSLEDLHRITSDPDMAGFSHNLKRLTEEYSGAWYKRSDGRVRLARCSVEKSAASDSLSWSPVHARRAFSYSQSLLLRVDLVRADDHPNCVLTTLMEEHRLVD